MKKVIVSTSINPPTEAILRFDAMKDWELIVVGDLKTPSGYKLERGIYVTPEMQMEYDPELSEVIGWNCIQRRNFGLLWAKERGAEIIAVVDDDNIPLPRWGEDLLLGRECEVFYYHIDQPVFDAVGATNEKHLWHRGFPLQLIPRRNYSNCERKKIVPQVQADFWNGDPDIDAICRMEHSPECQFEDSYFPISSNKISPFNSQNTFLLAACLKDYFLFPHIGRMDDIWASFYLQANGNLVVFGKPSVYQKRNSHDLIKDMKAEYLGYENNLKLGELIAKDSNAIYQFLPETSRRAFDLYRRHF